MFRMDNNHIRIAIVDDEPNSLKAISCFLQNEEDFFVVGTATNREDALKMAHALDIDVILMDIILSEDSLDGIDTLREIQRFSPAKVVMLTSLKDAPVILESFEAGAVNYINKSNYRSLPGIIREIANNHAPIQVLLAELSRLRMEYDLKALSKSEAELFELVRKGYKTKQICEILNKSEYTLKNQLHSIYSKMNVSGRKEAIEKYGPLA